MTTMADGGFWTPSRVLRGLLIWTSITTLIFWLPVVRGAFDGPSYEWSVGGFGGRGIHGDYWFAVLGALFGIGMQVLGWRGARFPIHVLLESWHVLLAALVLRTAIFDPVDLRLQGDTLGINLSLTWIGPILLWIPAVLSVWWAWDDLRHRERRFLAPWTPTNTRWLAALLVLLPIQFLCFRTGSAGGVADQVGVVVTVLQWILVGRALRPITSADADSSFPRTTTPEWTKD